MSDTTEMVRIIRHAADLLRAATDAEKTWSGGGADEQRRRFGTVAAMATANATLRMVAACMEPESEPNLRAIGRVRTLLKANEGPYVRADELLEALDGSDAS